MNLIKTLENAIKKREYPRVIKNLNKLCDELDYEVVGTCSSKMVARFTFKGMEITPQGMLFIPPQSYSFIRGSSCGHYSGGREGIIYSAGFAGSETSPTLTNLELYAYGKVWKGDMMLAKDRFKCIESEERLRVPSILKTISLKELEKVIRR
jgi:hypothetical protein